MIKRINNIEKLNVDFLGKKLMSPLVLPAGIMGLSYSGMIKAVENGAGMVTVKSLSLKPRKGHSGPVVTEFNGGVINSMGLCNPGIEEGLKEIEDFKKHINNSGLPDAPVNVSVFGSSVKDFEKLTPYVNDSQGDFIELNLSCPNVSDEYGVPIAASISMVKEIIGSVKNISKLPVIAKMSPNTYNVTEICIEAEKSGADALVLINGVGPGMLIDIWAEKPVIFNKFGGVSGPAIRPIAVKLVYETHKEVNIPIIGTGGVLTGDDAVEMLLAGANLVGVGTGVYYRGIEVFNKINEEIINYLKEKGLSTIRDINAI